MTWTRVKIFKRDSNNTEKYKKERRKELNRRLNKALDQMRFLEGSTGKCDQEIYKKAVEEKNYCMNELRHL